jgi:acetoin utilization protein AcuB
VVEGEQLIGILTDRDIRSNMPSPATSVSVWELNHLLARPAVGEVMTTNVIVVEPERPPAAAAALLLRETIGALPVMEADHLVGIVTETDFVRAFAASERVAAGVTVGSGPRLVVVDDESMTSPIF